MVIPSLLPQSSRYGSRVTYTITTTSTTRTMNGKRCLNTPMSRWGPWLLVTSGRGAGAAALISSSIFTSAPFSPFYPSTHVLICFCCSSPFFYCHLSRITSLPLPGLCIPPISPLQPCDLFLDPFFSLLLGISDCYFHLLFLYLLRADVLTQV